MVAQLMQKWGEGRPHQVASDNSFGGAMGGGSGMSGTVGGATPPVYSASTAQVGDNVCVEYSADV